ncbi:hypothetical protein MKW94_029330, partial [Papaver nudicaule]|nr:hypothetical protein [Papaver nudicaule]
MRSNSWGLFDTRYGNGCVLFDGNMYDMQKMVREAVDRSCGQLVEFFVIHICSDELLAYIAD